MTKISIIGAGSSFTQEISVDILNIPGFEAGTIALVDLDARRLDIARRLVELIVEKAGKQDSIQVIASTDRREVIKESDFVINQIEVNGLSTVMHEYEIPLKYGVKQCIGDTLGPGGLFKTLRTLPSWLQVVQDVEELCPNAMILNYTNPMSAVTLATSRSTSLPVVGLCHSIQHTSRQLAKYLDVPYGELKWRAGGINHMSWFVELTHNGKDMYPVLKERMQDPAILKQDPVRLDFMNYFGAFVSESSGHFSEYIPYYRKRQELIDTHCGAGYNGGTGFYATEWPTWRKETDEKMLRKISGEQGISMEPSHEYAAVIIEGVLTNVPKKIYGNVPNRGLIGNLPSSGVVEVACMVDHTGVQPTQFGDLPEHLAALCRSNMAFFELAVSAVLNNDREMAKHALMVDPLTAAVCSPAEIDAMFNELYEVEQEYLPKLK